MSANPGGFAYNDLSGIEAYAHPGARIALGIGLIGDPRVRAVADAGGEVLVYHNFMESPSAWGSAEGDRMYLGRPAPARFLWSPGRSNYAGTVMTDVKADSAWGHHYCETYVPDFRRRYPWIAGPFLDVHGERLWSSAWSVMSPQERTLWAAGMLWWSERIRAAWGEDAVLQMNGTWASGNPYGDPAIENHSLGETSWVPYLQMRWHGDGGFVITRNSGDVATWAARKGVSHVALDASNYARVTKPWGPFTGTGTPDPPPTPAPPPSSSLALPGIPTFTIAMQADGRASVAFTPRPAAEQVDAYQLYMDDVQIALGDQIVGNLAPGSTHYFRMSAHNASTAGNGKGYGPWTAVPLKLDVPAAPAPPPSSDPCADVKAQLETVSAARDTAVENYRAAAAERDDARAIALDLKGRIDAAKTALG